MFLTISTLTIRMDDAFRRGLFSFFNLADFSKRVVSKVCVINVNLQCYQAKSSSVVQTDLSTLQKSL